MINLVLSEDARLALALWGNLWMKVEICKSCGAEIVFIKTKKTGRWIPADNRILSVVTDAGEIVRGRQSHFATCPNADQHRRKGN